MNLILAPIIVFVLLSAAVILRVYWKPKTLPPEGLRCARCHRVLSGARPYRYTTCALCREDGDQEA